MKIMKIKIAKILLTYTPNVNIIISIQKHNADVTN
jgi:hypothetical protein